MGNNSFKDLIDFGTFSLVKLLRNLTPPSGRGWSKFTIFWKKRIRRDRVECSGGMVNTTVHVLCI